jgi:hypothetical protein
MLQDTGNIIKMIKNIDITQNQVLAIDTITACLPTVTFNFEYAFIFVTEVTALFDSLFSY